MLWDAQGHRAKAGEYFRSAEKATSQEKREHFERMAQSSLLLAKNAEWIQSTDEFLRIWKDHPAAESPAAVTRRARRTA